MIGFKQFLNEALIDIDAQDINTIYAPFAKPYKELQEIWKKHTKGNLNELTWANLEKWRLEKEFREVINKYDNGTPLKVFDSSQLRSKAAREAHALNPVKIYTYLIGDGNMYTPTKSTIYISLETGIYYAMSSGLSGVPFHQIHMLKNETLDSRIKSTIRHELTHWIDDSIHNFYITKAIKSTQSVKQAGGNWEKHLQKTLWAGERDPYLGPHEINAYVHQIAELKRRIGAVKYNKLTWRDLLTLIPSLDYSDTRLGADFRRKIFTRLARENLIGANLTKV